METIEWRVLHTTVRLFGRRVPRWTHWASLCTSRYTMQWQNKSFFSCLTNCQVHWLIFSNSSLLGHKVTTFNIKTEIKCIILLKYRTQYYLLINPMVLINYGLKCIDFTFLMSNTPHKQMSWDFADHLISRSIAIQLLTSMRNGHVHYANCNCIVVAVYLTKIPINLTKMKIHCIWLKHA